MKHNVWKAVCVCLLVAAQMLLMAGCRNRPEPEPDISGEGTGTVPDNPTSEPGSQGDDLPPEPVKPDLTLQYDDRYCFDSEVVSISGQKVTSTNAVTGAADAEVLRLSETGDRKQVIACGVGSARVTLADGSVKLTEVRPAEISMLLIIGQSNAEGQIQPDTGNFDGMTYRNAINQSILCEEGQIYSTYAPGLSTTHGSGVGNVSFAETLSISNAKKFVAKSLTSTVSMNGTALEYQLNSLSPAGQGKTGMDSGIAYEWHRATGDKVWVINAAHGGSAIQSWQPGSAKSNNDFWQAVELFSACEEVMRAEIAAGHYRLKHMGYFWLQGEANMGMRPEEYLSAYEAMHTGLKAELKMDADGDGTAERTLEFGAPLIVRASIAPHTTVADLTMRGPRIAQYYMGQTNTGVWSDVYLASTAAESWISDRSVSQYFSEKYGEQYPYTMRKATAVAGSMADVHPNIHYRQLGYNELGITAASTMASVILGEQPDASQAVVKLLRADGNTAYNPEERIVLEAGESIIAVPRCVSGLLPGSSLSLSSDIAGLKIGIYGLTAPYSAEDLHGTVSVLLNGQEILRFSVTVQAVNEDLPEFPSEEDFGSIVFPEIP